MTTLTGKTIASSYKDLLQVSNNNSGVDTTLRTVQDGEATNSALQLSNSTVNVNGVFQIGGDTLTATPSEINAIVSSTFTNLTAGTGIRMEVDASVTTNARTSTTILVSANQNFGMVSVSTGLAVTGAASFAIVSAASGVFSGIVSASEFAGNNTQAAAVSVLTQTNLDAITSINTVTDGIGTNTTNIAAVSVLTSVNLESITSINSLVNTNITNIAAVSVLTSVNLESITSINTVVGTVSSTMATSINNSNITIAAVSVLTSVNLAAITSINTVVGTVSSTMATSIANHMPLAGGAFTGTVSGTILHLSKSARADIVSLTDAASIALSFNDGQNFEVQLGGNRTLAAPTNCVTGQTGSIFIIQDGTGGRTLSYNANWTFPTAGTAPTLSTGVSAVDRLDYIVRTSTDVHAVATLDLQ